MINLQDRIERMCYLGPEFIDITWGAGGSRPAATLEVVSTAQKVYGVETCMHLICTNNPTDNIDKALNVSFFLSLYPTFPQLSQLTLFARKKKRSWEC